MIVLPAILRSCLGKPSPTLVPAPPASTTATTGKTLLRDSHALSLPRLLDSDVGAPRSMYPENVINQTLR